MTIRQELTNAFNNLEKVLNTTSVQQQVQQVQANFEAAGTALYKNQGQIVGGFKQVADTVTDVVSSIDGSVPTQVLSQLGVAQLDASAAKQLTKDASSDRADLTSITGKAALAADGFLDVVITLPHPEALAAAIKNTTTLTGQQIANIVQDNIALNNTQDESEDDNIVDPIQNIIGNLFPDLKSISSQLNNTISAIAANTSTLLSNANNGFGSLVENTIESALQTSYKLLGSVTNRSIHPDKFITIIELANQGKTEEAARLLKNYSDQTIEQLEAVISQINNKASAQITESKTPKNLTVQRTDSLKNLWRDATTDPESGIFSPLTGPEVTAEVLNMTRDVTEIIVMFVGEPGATIQDYHGKYVSKYNIGFNPHYYIGYDAKIYRGRPLEIEANSKTTAITNNHNQRSIIIAVNVNDKSYTHKFGPSQRDKLLLLIEKILDAKPGMQVYSAKDVGWSYKSGEDALDVALFVQKKLGKSNVAGYDPKTQDPLTSTQLANFYVGI